MNKGKVTQVIGSTFDAEFSADDIPGIYNALKIDVEFKGKHIKVTGIPDRDDEKRCMENIPQDCVHGLFDKAPMVGEKGDDEKINDLSCFFPAEFLVRENLAFKYV